MISPKHRDNILIAVGLIMLTFLAIAVPGMLYVDTVGSGPTLGLVQTWTKHTERIRLPSGSLLETITIESYPGVPKE
jgi:hypothetical protein